MIQAGRTTQGICTELYLKRPLEILEAKMMGHTVKLILNKESARVD
jgi:hypothetical protein